MSESREMEVIPVGDSVRFGDLPQESEEQGILTLSEGKDLGSPKIRRSERRRASRSLSARGRLAKSSPKSPLMRMAGMRKGGLRGRALRLSGLKGLEGSVVKANKGKKGGSGRGSQVLAVAGAELEESLGWEGSVARDGSSGDLVDVMPEEDGGRILGEGVSSADKVLNVLSKSGDGVEGMVLDVRNGGFGGKSGVVEKGVDPGLMRLERGVEVSTMVVNEMGLVMNDMDIALDLCEAQPLQNTEFLKAEGVVRKGVEGSKWAGKGEVSQIDFSLGGRFLNEDFPSLREGINRKGKSGEAAQAPRKGSSEKPESSRIFGAEAEKNHSFPM